MKQNKEVAPCAKPLTKSLWFVDIILPLIEKTVKIKKNLLWEEYREYHYFFTLLYRTELNYKSFSSSFHFSLSQFSSIYFISSRSCSQPCLVIFLCTFYLSNGVEPTTGQRWSCRRTLLSQEADLLIDPPSPRPNQHFQQEGLLIHALLLPQALNTFSYCLFFPS